MTVLRSIFQSGDDWQRRFQLRATQRALSMSKSTLDVHTFVASYVFIPFTFSFLFTDQRAHSGGLVISSSLLSLFLLWSVYESEYCD